MENIKKALSRHGSARVFRFGIFELWIIGSNKEDRQLVLRSFSLRFPLKILIWENTHPFRLGWYNLLKDPFPISLRRSKQEVWDFFNSLDSIRDPEGWSTSARFKRPDLAIRLHLDED